MGNENQSRETKSPGGMRRNGKLELSKANQMPGKLNRSIGGGSKST